MNELDPETKKLKVLELVRLQIYCANKQHTSLSSKQGVLAAMDWIDNLYNNQVEASYANNTQKK